MAASFSLPTITRDRVSTTFQAVYRYALMPLKRRGVTVLRLDHLGKDAENGARGSSAKGDDVDVVWHLTKKEKADTTTITLKLDRARSADYPKALTLTRQTSPLTHVRTATPTDEPHTLEMAPQDVLELVALLDRLKVPHTAGRPKVRELLKAAGHEDAIGSNMRLATAVRLRKAQQDSTEAAAG